MRLQRRNFLDAARPEIVLGGWARIAYGPTLQDTILVRTIKNVGRGVALQLAVECEYPNASDLTALGSSVRIPILAVDEEQSMSFSIAPYWESVRDAPKSPRSMLVNVRVSAWDVNGYRHLTWYRTIVFDPSYGQGAGAFSLLDELAPYVGLLSRTTTRRSLRGIRFRNRLARIPWIGKRFRDN